MKKGIIPRSEVPTPFDPDHPRYSDLPFPAYRFIPGITEHPHLKNPPFPAPSDPSGHLPRQAGESPPFFKVGSSEKDETYFYGIDLYNFSYWWEAHEAWELVWKTTNRTDETALFLQGLIQISAGMIKWWTGNLDGMRKLFKEGTEKLKGVSTQKMMGLDLKGHLTKIQQFKENPAPENYPFINLR